MADPRTPSGRTFALGVDDLFFTTTDRRGRIEAASSVFLDLAQFSFDDVDGAPHNVLRHPDMPAGAFAIMWERLQAGLPMAAYVKNMARDGSAYWVFATITPRDGGYLSVRTAPCCPDLLAAVESVYVEVRAVEERARGRGLSRAAVAQVGAAELGTRLAALGFPTYEDVVRHLVPAEIAARVARSGLRRESATASGTVRGLLESTARLDDGLRTLLNRLAGMQRLADDLHQASVDARGAVSGLAQATEVAVIVSGAVASSVPVLGRTARGMAEGVDEVASTLRALADELAAVADRTLDLRYRIALSQLQTDMMTALALEVARAERAGLRTVGGARDLGYVPLLCAAVEEVVVRLSDDVPAVRAALLAAKDNVELAVDLLRRSQRAITTWRLLVPRYELSTLLGPQMAPIDRQLVSGLEHLARLRHLADRCADEARPFDTRPLRDAVLHVERASSAAVAATSG